MNEFSSIKRPKGRPRIRPIKYNHIKRPVGRPLKVNNMIILHNNPIINFD
jgi:hypothetical protein